MSDQTPGPLGSGVLLPFPARIIGFLLIGSSIHDGGGTGAAVECRALTGAIVAAGDRYGMAMPLNRALLTLLRAINDAIGA